MAIGVEPLFIMRTLGDCALPDGFLKAWHA